MGAAREGQERPDEALTLFQKALADDAGCLLALHGLRRQLPEAKKHEFLTQLLKAPKPHDLYEELVREARIGKDKTTIALLAEWLHKERPRDLRAIKDLIPIRAEAGKTAEAIELYKAALKTNPDDKNRNQVRYVFLSALADKDQHLEAYMAVVATDAKAAFNTLAFDLDEKLSDLFNEENDKSDEFKTANELLDKLIAAHRLRVPGDPWPSYFEGQRFLRVKNYAAADKKFAEGLAKTPYVKEEKGNYESHYDDFRSARVESLYKLGQGLTAYRDLPPKDETFDELAWMYQRDHDVMGLRKLLDAHRVAEPMDAALDYWMAQLHWEDKDYEAAVRLLRRYSTTKQENERLRYYWSVNDQITRGLIRLKRPLEARDYVVELGETAPDILRVLSFSANGDHGLATVLMLDVCAKSAWQVEMFYTDPDLGPHLSRDEYKPFRDQHPQPPPRPEKKK